MIWRPIYLFGCRAGVIEAGDGWHHAYAADGSAVGRYSTDRRAAHALEFEMLQSLYPSTVEVLLHELRRGLVCLDQDYANLNRLERCDETQIREISTCLLEWRWSKQELAKLIAKWRELRGQS